MQDESMINCLGPFAFCIGVALSSSEKNKVEGFEKPKKKDRDPKYKYLIDDTVKDIHLHRAIQMTEENMIQFFEKAN